ncbi:MULTISPECIES: homoprotocatechuate degradation operon regulator HpaR [Sediminimonas]|uniref:homoprotocatechuate degradation operon regulator HpaR n=1 Tax=Sediminimonas TaxID=659427 RepID=UPI000413F11D|nr:MULTISPECIES: homoprotocatechuate degradation operon regulator HpaR [Sediminimonas]MDR9485654.1 homoprotocatechuate degradation operon regulator HpaR [Sediminimonas sp.]
MDIVKADAPETDRSLPIALLRARERVMGPIRNMLADVGVTEQQWRVLRVLDECGTLDPTDIADRSCLLLPSLTRIMQTLVTKGLITRAPHPSDRRKQLITITEAGRALIRDNLEESRRLNRWMRDNFGSERLDLLLDLLNELDRMKRGDDADGAAAPPQVAGAEASK